MSNQQRKKAPWMSPPPPNLPGKKSIPYWPWMILVALLGVVILLVVIYATANLLSSGTPGTTQNPDLTTPQGIDQYTLRLAQNSGASGTIVSSRYETSVKGLVITETIGAQPDHITYRANIEDDCFFIQQAIWKSNINLAAVEVHILGPLTDPQGRTKTDPIGICGLKEQTEQKFSWSNLTSNQAWNHYDAIWMRPELYKTGDQGSSLI